MNRHKNKLIMITAVTLLFSQPLGSFIHAEEFKKFEDVKPGHWAEKYITRLSLQETLLGEKGKFKPERLISKQEAVTIAIRFMGLEESAKKQTAVAFPEHFKVGNYFKPYVSEALQRNVLDRDEEMEAGKQSKLWGNQQATREWVAKLLIRALGREQEAQKAMTSDTDFIDHKKISPQYVGYVKLASDLKITTGTANKEFQPDKPISRAEMATFFGRAQESLQTNKKEWVEGTVNAKTRTHVSITAANGTTKEYHFSPSFVLFEKGTSTATNIDQLTTGSKVVGWTKGSQLAYLELKEQASVEEERQTQATVIQPQQVKSQIREEQTAKVVLKHPDRQLSLIVGERVEKVLVNADVALLDQQRNAITFEQFPAQAEVKIGRAENNQIISIQINASADHKIAEGKVVSVDPTGVSLIIYDVTNGHNEQYKVSEDLVVRHKDKILLRGLADLKSEDEIEYTVRDNMIYQINLKQQQMHTLKATLCMLDDEKRMVTYRRDGEERQLEIKFFKENVEVVIEGVKEADLGYLVSDMDKGDQVEFTLNEKDVITKIEVLNRKVDTLRDAKVASYNAKLKLLTVVDQKERAHSYYLDKDTKFDFGYQTSLEELKKNLVDGTKISITFVGDRVLKLQRLHYYKGTIEYFDFTSGKLVLRMSNGLKQEVKVAPSAPLFRFGEHYSLISSLKIGEKIIAFLSESQESISSISVITNIEAEVYEVRDKKIYLKEKNGYIENYDISGVLIYDEKNDIMVPQMLKAGQQVYVQMAGRIPKQIKVASYEYMKVLQVETSSSSVIFKDEHSKVKTISFIRDNRILREDGSAGSLHTLSIGDCVAISTDFDQVTTVQKTKKVTRKYWKYDDRLQVLYTKKDSISDTHNEFNIAPQVYIHQGTNTIGLQSLAEFDELQLTVHRDQVVEIEKK